MKTNPSIMATISVYLVLFSTLMVTRGYQVVLLGAVFVFCFALLNRRLILDLFSLAIGSMSLFIWVFLCRELIENSQFFEYFVSSFLVYFSFTLILLSVHFSQSNLELLWKGVLLLIMLQALVVYMRFLGVVDIPIPFGESESNKGMVSIQQREQLTAVSLCLQFIVAVFLADQKGRQMLACMTAFIALPAVFLTGSTLAVGVFAFGMVYLALSSLIKMTKFAKGCFVILALFLVLQVIPLFFGGISQQYEDSGSDKFEAISVVAQIQDPDLLLYKIWHSNSRVTLLKDSVQFISEAPQAIFFGSPRERFIEYTGGLSPHSIISELISLSGLVGLYLVICFIVIAFMVRRKSIAVLRFGTMLLMLILTGTINSINMGVPLLAIFALLMRPRRQLSNNKEMVISDKTHLQASTG